MDLLSQYKQDHPEASQEKKPLPLTDEYGRTYTGMIGFAMRFLRNYANDAGFIPPFQERAGFTLIELLVVISIISLLSSVVFASVNSARNKARYARAGEELMSL